MALAAIDSNVLLRYLLEDDPVQSAAATRIMTGGDQILISDVVLAETLWTLTGRKYRATKDDLEAVMYALFEETKVEFEDENAVWRAFQDFRNTEVDFQDALILRKAQNVSRRLAVNFLGLYTFDKAALKLEGAIYPG